ncbi:MAG: RNA-directed DNA polymerase [Thermomicrobiales bacterium]|nr:RNA-directed DNA polymerase [Thermomicrobiales bacterium]
MASNQNELLDEKEFQDFFSAATIRDLSRQSLRPYGLGELPKGDDRLPYLENLFASIRGCSYLPDLPRAYNMQNKGEGVPRVIPVLSFRDLAIYYFCYRKLEEVISRGRVDFTFGGYSLKSVLRDQEHEELASFQDEWDELRAAEMADFAYSGSGSVRPSLWVAEWKEFQRISYHIASTRQPLYALKFDLSNFYDNISLGRLELKLREICDPHENRVVDLLFVFLRYWNRGHEGYPPKSVGIPQDESGDSSRLLANLYLQEYDRWLKQKAESRDVIYLRYADDQVLFGNDSDLLYDLMYRAGVYLRKEGLNINAGKVRFYANMEDFGKYWAFDLFADLEGKPEASQILHVVETLLGRCEVEQDFAWRWDGIMRRILSVGLPNSDSDLRSRFLEFVLNPERITRLSHWHFMKIWDISDSAEKKKLLDSIDSVAPTVPFNQFHLELRRFYSRVKLNERMTSATTAIDDRSLSAAIL